MKQPPHNACSIADATVTVNSLPTDRFGPWWRHAFEADNDTSAAYTQAVITAVQSNLYSSATGRVFVAGTPEAFTHDDDGNLTQDGRFDYTWDAENRLVSAATRDDLPAGVPRVRVTHRYDHQSRRIATERETWGGSAWQPAGTNRYLYDGWNVVAETRSASPANTNLYVWGLDLSGSLQGAGGIGGLLTVRKRLEDGTGIVRNYDYLFDANGNVVQEIFRNDGAINAHYEYDPFGTAVIALRVDATDNPFRFSTKWFDNDTGLGYWGYRWYSPSIGRWMSRDPITEKGGINLYGAFGNSPLKGYDMLGLAVVTDGSCSSEMKEKLKDAFDKLQKAVADAKAQSKMKCCLENAGFKGTFADHMINRMKGTGASIIVKCTDCLNKNSCGFVCNKDGSLPSDQCKVPGINSGTIYMCNGQFGSSKCPAHCTLLHELGHSVGQVPTETAPPASEKCLSGCPDSK